MIWVIYCWRDSLEDDHPSYLPEIEELVRQAEEEGYQICAERMDFTFERRLWDQMVDKIFELMTGSSLSLSDRCAFVVSHSLLPGETFLVEDAYISDHVCDYPKGTFPCIGHMYL